MSGESSCQDVVRQQPPSLSAKPLGARAQILDQIGAHSDFADPEHDLSIPLGSK